MVHIHPSIVTLSAVPLMLLTLSLGCKEDAGTLAPYTDIPGGLSQINIQDSVFTPRVTWLGGYVTAFGVNQGTTAVLDSTLVSLIYAPGDGVKFPLTFGTVPQGTQERLTQYGGTRLTRLIEDRDYTFWILKETAWNQVAAFSKLPMVVDSNATVTVQRRNDTLYLSTSAFMKLTKRVDVYINIKNLRVYGRLCGSINVIASDTSDRPLITFTVTQAGAPDTKVSAIGICLGSDYRVDNRVWEVISADVRQDTTIYWKDDVIASPLVMGLPIPGTAEFISYPSAGLRRGDQYYLWLANKNWDQTTRTRAIPNYGFATFTVW
jgi:hypothetical protein